MKLSNKFRQIQIQADNIKKLPAYDINEEINKDEYKEAFEAVQNRINYKMKNNNNKKTILSSDSVPRKIKKKRDIRFDKLCYILPDFLLKKLEWND